jgi:uncharacterized protein YdhG (YjbR/CyaY superfamily)
MEQSPDVDAYIAAADAAGRPHLQALRSLIRATLPQAEESIWYGVPFYKHNGEIVGITAHQSHVSFGIGAAVFDAAAQQALRDQGYKHGKATVQIRFDQPLPTAILEQLLRAKLAHNEDKGG